MSPNRTFAVFATASKTLVTGVLLLAAFSAHATMVEGGLDPAGGTSVSPDSFTPAIVSIGAAPEFSGEVTDLLWIVLTVGVDLFDSQILITTSVPLGSQWGGGTTGQGFTVSLTVLEWSGSTGIIRDVELVNPDDVWTQTITVGEDFVDVDFVLAPGHTTTGLNYTYELTIEHVDAVPEPRTLALLALGLAVIGSRRRQIR